MSALLLLLACSNRISVGGDLDFEIGSVKSALWAQSSSSDPSRGDGEAVLLMVNEPFTCDDLFETLKDDSGEDSIVWSAKGLAASFYWYSYAGEDAGWEGVYAHGSYAIPVAYLNEYYYYYSGDEDFYDRIAPIRMAESALFADGSIYGGYYWTGQAEITGYSESEVSGTIKTEAYNAAFKAENCGKEGGGSRPKDDTGW